MKCNNIEFLRLWNSAMTTRQIAVYYGVDSSWIRAKARHLRLGGYKTRLRTEQISLTKKGVLKSAEHKAKISETSKKRRCPEHLKKLYSAKFKGQGNPNWRGGISSERQVIYRSDEYRAWRDSVKYRDNYTCQFCGVRGGWLEAHHIKPFETAIDLRFSLLNGITLCRKCHKQTFGKEPSYEGKCLEKLPC